MFRTPQRVAAGSQPKSRSCGVAHWPKAVVNELGLRLSLLEPRVIRRSDLIRDVKVSDSAATADYSLVRQDDGRFVLVKDSCRNAA